MNTTILIVVLGVYLLAMLGIGLVGKKKYGGSFDSLISAGRSAGVLMFAGGAIGAHIGNGFVVGGTADAASVGLSGMWYGLCCAISYIFCAFFLNKRVYQAGYISLPEFLRARYNDKFTSVMFSLVATVGLVGNIGVQILAGKALFISMGLDGNMGAIVITLVVLAYSALSGLWAAMATSVVQIGVIAAGLIITTVTLFARGGFTLISDAIASGALPATFLSPIPQGGVASILTMLIPITMAVMADQCTVQRIVACKSEGAAMKGWILSIVMIVPLALMPTFIGMYGAAAYGASGTSSFFTVILNGLNPFVAAVMVAAVLAAIMSTVDAFFVAISTVILNDMYRGMINPKASEKTLTTGNYIITALVAGVGLTIALIANNIVGLLVSCCAFVAAGSFAPFMGGLLWKGGTRTGAIVSSITGVAFMTLSMTGILPLPMGEVSPTVISVIVYIIVSLATKQKTAGEM